MNIKRERGKFTVESETHRGVLYEVKYSKMLHRYICGCPDFRYRKFEQGKDCKHIKAINEALVLVGMM